MNNSCTLVDVALRNAERLGNSAAFVFLDSELNENQRLTFAALDLQARSIAVGLREHARQGDRVLLNVGSQSALISAFFGCLYAGMIAVPAVPPTSRRTAQTRRWMALAADCDARIAIADASPVPNPQLPEEPAAHLPSCRTLSLAEVTADPQQWRRPALSADALAFLQYTSGSTSAPKGVMITHANVLANQELIKERFRHDARSIFLSWLPLQHDMGLIGHVMQPLYLGVTSYLLSPMTFLGRPVQWLRAVSRFRATTSGGPNFGYQYCVDRIRAQDLQQLDLSDWRTAYIGAEPIRADTLELFAAKFRAFGFRRRAFLPCYGLAEATLFVCGSEQGAEPIVKSFTRDARPPGMPAIYTAAMFGQRAAQTTTVRVVSCGPLATHSGVEIVDPSTCLRCEPGVVGEIWVSGASVASGYWQRNEESAAFGARLHDEPGASYLRTGDLGFSADGQLFISGRAKDLIIIRGRNFAPQDIEASARRTEPVLPADACAAVAVERDNAEQLVVIQEVTRAMLRGADQSATLRGMWHSIITDHGVAPFEIVMIKPGALPRTTSGKIQRGLARELYERERLEVVQRLRANVEFDRAGLNTDYVAPATELERALVSLWSEALRLPAEAIGTADHFFDLGGDSIAIVQLQARIQQTLQISAASADLFSCRNIAALAKHLTETQVSRGQPAIPLAVEQDAAANSGDKRAIAIIGLAGRFPDAASVQELWCNLAAGKESVRTFTEEEMLAAGAHPALLGNDNLVKAGIVLEGIDQFDADYFGMTPREAQIMDPQQRMLLECAVEALENAGHVEEAGVGAIGVFVARGESIYAHRFVPLFDQRSSVGMMIATLIATSRGYASTLVSYHLQLTGPSTSVDTACSSSLVAVHQACRSLLAGECEIAIAGGVGFDVLQGAGYLYEEGNIASPDGHCRAFSSDAQGTVRGGGAGLVVLRRLKSARASRDTIHAVIRGSAINNDGARKMSFTAPSAAGQAEVIKSALDFAGVDPATVQYVETHGTSTLLGDPIEIAAFDASVRDRRGPQRAMRDRLAEDKHRSSGSRRGHRRPDQNGAGAPAQAHSCQPELQGGQSSDRFLQRLVLRQYHVAGVGM